jgi:putative nucleotidyltransferase with HDIG domain
MAVLRLARLAPAQRALLRATLAAAGRGARPALVGGAVRDAWLGRGDGDLDVAVPAGAVALARRLAARAGGTAVVLDAERGAARVVVGRRHVDITEFRAPTLEADLAARDFTVNALAVDLRTLLAAGAAPVVDPTGGLADLRRRRLRAAGSAVLADDPLRALRAVRLEVALGLRLTAATARAIRAVAPALGSVAVERIRDELLLALGAGRTARALRRADALGLLRQVLPEVEAMRGVGQPAPHRFDVLEHSLRAVEAADRLLPRLGRLTPFGEGLARHMAEELGGGVTRGAALKLAALLHDVAKPETRRIVDGRVRFFEHDTRGADRVRGIGGRLRLPARVTEVVERLVRHHLRPMHLGQADAISPRARYRFYRDLGGETRDLLLLSLVDAAALTGVSPLRAWRRAGVVRDLLAGWREQETALAAGPLVTGDDVMARLGIPPGPRVGLHLDRVREAQALGLVRTRAEALAYLDSSAAGP